MKIDSHQHFWVYHQEKQDWINEAMSVIRRDFTPSDLAPILKTHDIDGCVAVQADQTEEETHYLVQLAEANAFIKGVVGWVDLQAENIADRLAYFKTFPIIKGFRHVVQGEPTGFMLRDAFKRGIKALQLYGYTYDILVYHHQLEDAIALVKDFPEQPFVLDHIGKPAIADGNLATWKAHIHKLAAYPNIMCKLSGMVTEADWGHWKNEDFKPYLDVVVEAFGIDRLMYGSDWPVCLVAGSYTQVKGLMDQYFQTFTASEQQKFWGENAAKFYNIQS